MALSMTLEEPKPPRLRLIISAPWSTAVTIPLATVKESPSPFSFNTLIESISLEGAMPIKSLL